MESRSTRIVHIDGRVSSLIGELIAAQAMGYSHISIEADGVGSQEINHTTTFNLIASK